MRPISRCLNSQLLDICQRAVQLDELKTKIKDFLPSSLAEYFQVGSFNQGCLLLTTTEATWANLLRYSLPELRDKLRAAGLFQLISIKLAVITVDYDKPFVKQRQQTLLSATARNSIRVAGERCTFQPLKEALYRLARERARNNFDN
jgi:hypothetical protein